MNEMELIAWILRGSQRRIIFRLMDKIQVPSQIYRQAYLINPKISRNNVSDILSEFRREKIAECLNPTKRIGRLYKLTKLGEKLKDKI